MLQIQIERIAFISIWVLNLDLPSLVGMLSQKGYITARIKPRFDAYEIGFLEPPNVIAVKGATRICYDVMRRSLEVESPHSEEALSALKDLDEILESSGMDPKEGALVYELQVKAKISGVNMPLGKLSAGDLLGEDLLYIPSLFVIAKGNPNSSKWFDLRLTPIWATWAREDKRVFELTLVYRDKKEKMVFFAQSIKENLEKLMRRICKGGGE